LHNFSITARPIGPTPFQSTYQRIDVLADAKAEAALTVNDALEAGWEGLEIAERFPLEETAGAREAVEHPTKAGRVVVTI
jgi:hypothetical protein